MILRLLGKMLANKNMNNRFSPLDLSTNLIDFILKVRDLN